MKTPLLILCLLGLMVTPALAQEIESTAPGRQPEIESTAPGRQPGDPPRRRRERQSTPILDTLGQASGSDNPNLRGDVRDFRNILGVGASVLQEFTGINTSEHFGYLDLVLGSLFGRGRERTNDIGGSNPNSQTASGQGQGLSESIIGAAGIANPEAVALAISQGGISQGQGGGRFGINPVFAIETLEEAANLQLSQDALNASLSEEGQALIAQTSEQLVTATEGVNAVAEEANAAQSSLDTQKLRAKQAALQAAISQINASETQQVRLAMLEGNKATFAMHKMMLSDHWKTRVEDVAQEIETYRSAQLFVGTLRPKTLEEEGIE